MKNDRLYVIVRKDLTYSSPEAQAGHVIAEFCLTSKNAKKWNNRTLVLLGADDIQELRYYIDRCFVRDITITKFHEPDMIDGDELTGFCFLMDKEDADFLRLLSLL